MKRTILCMLLVLYVWSSKVNGEELTWGSCTTYAPMPVLFIHGINANSLNWDTATKELEKYFGYRWVQFNKPTEPITKKGQAVTYDETNPDAPQNKVVKHYLEAFDYGGKDSMGSFKGLDEHNNLSDKNSLSYKVNEILQAYYGDDWEKQKLIIVGHSQGGLIARYYIQHGGADKVKRLITLGTPHLGSNLAVPPRVIGLPANLPILGKPYETLLLKPAGTILKTVGIGNFIINANMQALVDLCPNSRFLEQLNSNVANEKGVEYVCLVGRVGLPLLPWTLDSDGVVSGKSQRGEGILSPIEIITLEKTHHLNETNQWQDTCKALDGIPPKGTKTYDTPIIQLFQYGTENTFTNPYSTGLYYKGSAGEFKIAGEVYDYLPGSSTVTIEIKKPDNSMTKSLPMWLSPVKVSEAHENSNSGRKYSAKFFRYGGPSDLSVGTYSFRVTVENPAGLIGTATTGTPTTDWIPFEIIESIPTPILLWQKEFDQNIGNISVTGDGEYIVVDTIPSEFIAGSSVAGTNTIYLFDKSGNMIWQHSSIEYGTKGYVGGSGITKDGSRIFTFITLLDEYWISKLMCLDGKNGNLLWKTDKCVPGAFSISTDGKYILTANEIDDNYAILFDKNGNQIWEKEDVMGWPIISGDGNYILLSNQLFDKNGSLLWEKDNLKFIGGGISNNGDTIVSQYHNPMQLFDSSGNLLGEYKCEGEKCLYPTLSANGKYIIATDGENKVYFFNRQATILWEKTYSDVGHQNIITDDGRYSAVAYGYLNIDILDQNGNVEGQIKLEGKGKKDLIMKWSSDGKYLAITGREKKLYFYDNSNILSK